MDNLGKDLEEIIEDLIFKLQGDSFEEEKDRKYIRVLSEVLRQYRDFQSLSSYEKKLSGKIESVKLMIDQVMDLVEKNNLDKMLENVEINR